MASFTKEVNPRLAKCPLRTNRRLANRGLTSIVKEAIDGQIISKLYVEIKSWTPGRYVYFDLSCKDMIIKMLINDYVYIFYYHMQNLQVITQTQQRACLYPALSYRPVVFQWQSSFA